MTRNEFIFKVEQQMSMRTKDTIFDIVHQIVTENDIDEYDAAEFIKSDKKIYKALRRECEEARTVKPRKKSK